MLRIATLFGFAAGAMFFVACANVAFSCSDARSPVLMKSRSVSRSANRRQLTSELFCDSLVP